MGLEWRHLIGVLPATPLDFHREKEMHWRTERLSFISWTLKTCCSRCYQDVTPSFLAPSSDRQRLLTLNTCHPLSRAFQSLRTAQLVMDRDLVTQHPSHLLSRLGELYTVSQCSPGGWNSRHPEWKLAWFFTLHWLPSPPHLTSPFPR